ncbi:MAG: ABC transporter substrate-binding protein, partial [Myxococcota bacterium]
MRQTFDQFDRAPALNRKARRFARLFGAQRTQSAIDQKLGVDAVILLGSGKDTGVAVRVLREAGVELPIFGTEAAATDDFLAEAGRDVGDVYAIATTSPDFANVRFRAFQRRFQGTPSHTDVLLYESLELVSAAVGSATEATAAAVLADLSERQVADKAVEGLGSLLYVDGDGVMQRDPWILLLDRGRFRPAYTQLRPVVDPRELWEATQTAEAAAEPAPTPTRRGSRRGRRDVAQQAVEVVQKGSKVTLGGTAYHRTAVVYAGIDFFRVNEVDVGGQAFDVELYLWFRWQGDVDVDNIGFLNQINTEDALFEVVRQDLDSATKYICYKVKGRFLTPFDLHDFPFDQQRLPIQLSHATLDSRSLLLVVDHDRLSHDEITAIYPEEWEYRGRRDASGTYAPTTTFGDPAYEGLASRSEFSIYQTEIVLDRILFPYLITLFLPLAIMVGISLFVVLIPPSQFDARLTLTMTALLSVVVFHLAQGEDLPNVGYLMRADQYFMVAYLLLFVLIIKTVLVNLLVPRLSKGLIARGEWLFAILFVPATLLLYGTLSFDSPLEWIADRWLRPPPAEGIDTLVTPDEPTDQTPASDATVKVVEPEPEPVVQRDDDEIYVTCNGQVVTL